MKYSSKRIGYIDVARGIAILLVVLGHCIGSSKLPLNKFILSFHMPLFFFLSGFFAKSINREELLNTLKNKFQRLIVPQVFLCLLFFLNSLLRFFDDGGSWENIQVLVWPWFLPVLFDCTVLYALLSCFLKIDLNIIKIVFIVSSLLGAIAILTIPDTPIMHHWFLGHFRLVPMAFVFYLSGGLFKNIAVIHTIEKKINIPFYGLIPIIMGGLLFVVSNLNSPVLFYENEYGNLFLFLLSTVMGIWLVLHVSKLIENSEILAYIGQNSLQVFIWNFTVILICGYIVHRVVAIVYPGIDVYSEAFITFAMVLPVILLVIKITNKIAPWMYGGGKTK